MAPHHGRTEVEQARENLRNALRALDMLDGDCSGLVPHPLTVAAAELKNALSYLDNAHRK